MEKTLPSIPAKRYFTIGEVSDLCGVKPYVLRYWEQEFTQLKPMKRRGNRRYYQHHEVLLIRRIRDLLYDQGFTISGARNRLLDGPAARETEPSLAADPVEWHDEDADPAGMGAVAMALKVPASTTLSTPVRRALAEMPPLSPDEVRSELLAIRALLIV
jgi:DNA-binding transcriptional MerR regulator